MSRILVTALALGALAAAALLIGPGASAQSPAGRTLSFTELEKGATFKHIRNTKPKSPRANSLGDVLVFTNPLADASGKVVGRLHASCATTVGARNFLKSVITCDGAAVLRDGTLHWQASFKVGASAVKGAITGGTGAYANARGGFVSAKDERGGSQDTFTLAG
jgi:hypothetical protein